MIIDTIVARCPMVGKIIGSPHVFQVPVQLMPVDADGVIDWRDPPRPLVPRVAVGDRWAIRADWLTPPYERMVLVNPLENAFIYLERLDKQDEEEWAYRIEPYTLAGSVCVCPYAGTLSSVRIGGDAYISMDVSISDGVALTCRLNGRDAFDDVEMEVGEVERDNFVYGISASLALINCKNVVKAAVVPSRQQRRAAKRAGTRQPYSYHVLELRVGGRRTANGVRTTTTEPIALHWVRGHFKEYGGEKGLFGKHRGVYWWSPHLAGQSDRVVDKDYRVAPQGQMA